MLTQVDELTSLRRRDPQGRLHPRRALRHGRLVARARGAAPDVRRRQGRLRRRGARLDRSRPRSPRSSAGAIRRRRSTSSRPSRAARPSPTSSSSTSTSASAPPAATQAGQNFVAITDPGTAMEKRAREHGFRRIFLNRAEIGGRYSALSHFGLVPAALMGIDVAKLLKRAKRMMLACGPTVSAAQNPGLYLGAVIGTLAKAGRDKLTFVVDKKLDSFGYWTEQLIAESTGKEGTGIVPVEGEPIGAPASYGKDRVFAYVRLDGGQERAVQSLIRAGHPVVAMRLERRLRSRRRVPALGDRHRGRRLGARHRSLRSAERAGVEGQHRPPARGLQRAGRPARSGRRALGERRRLRRPADGAPEARQEGRLRRDHRLRRAHRRRARSCCARSAPRIRDRFQVATTVGYGPRFLHSTGQLHKGGAANGVFVQLSAEPAADLSIPGERFTFGTLEAAQALGDYESLAKRGRRAIRVALGADVDAGLRAAARGARRRRQAGTAQRAKAVGAAAGKPKAKPARRAAAKSQGRGQEAARSRRRQEDHRAPPSGAAPAAADEHDRHAGARQDRRLRSSAPKVPIRASRRSAPRIRSRSSSSAPRATSPSGSCFPRSTICRPAATCRSATPWSASRARR